MLARRILIATDGSDHSIRALEHAHSLVHGHGHHVALIHVMSGEQVPAASLDDHPQVEDPTARGERILADACHILGVDEEEVQKILVKGNPAAEMVKAARAIRADLIIMGCRGVSGWKGSKVGSVSQAMVREAPCSVLVVKEQIEHRYGAG